MTPRVAMLSTAARPLYAVMVAASVWILLRGHNEPGGGFIAALVATSATVLWAVAHGSVAATRRLPLRSPLRLGAAGLTAAMAAGLPAWGGGEPYMTHLWGTVDLLVTQLKVSTVLVFDLGVYLCVWGALAGYVLPLIALDEAGETGPAAGEAP